MSIKLSSEFLTNLAEESAQKEDEGIIPSLPMDSEFYKMIQSEEENIVVWKNKFYEHYKTKNIYYILYEARHSETLEPLVIYKSNDNDNVWARPKSMFFEKVEHNGVLVDRFCELTYEEIDKMTYNY